MGGILKMILEITVFSIGIYLILRFLRRTRGSGVIRGLTLLLGGGVVAFYVMIEALELARLQVVFEAIAAWVVIGLIVIFQPEIRRAIVHLGDSPIFKRFLKGETHTLQRLLRSVSRMSKDRVGALIAIEREGSLANMAETGSRLDAEINSYLIEAIFHPGSPLHDGAIVIRGDRIVAAGCVLPVSHSPNLDKRLGTRHRAAVGLTEETDALTLVVSEETGKISAAIGGSLRQNLSLESLEQTVEENLGLR
jgi:diadenylate cyclase